MTERREYEMTQDDLDVLLAAAKPSPLIMMQCGLAPTPQECANAAWDALGHKMGFVGSTVLAIPGKSNRFFTAEPVL